MTQLLPLALVLVACKNGTATFEKHMQLLEYQNNFYLKTADGQNSNLLVNVVHFLDNSAY